MWYFNYNKITIYGIAVLHKTQTGKQSALVKSAGLRPTVELARKDGPAINPTGGIEVAGNLRTSIATIYPGGSCVGIQDMVRVYKTAPIPYDINIFRSCENAISYSIRERCAVTEQFP